jgi:hypothetical protein
LVVVMMEKTIGKGFAKPEPERWNSEWREKGGMK